MGYKFQFITLAGFHSLNAGMYELAYGYARHGMTQFVKLQQHEFEMEQELGFKAIKHQKFVGTGYFDLVQNTVNGGAASTVALKGSTEEAQFHAKEPQSVHA
jgi:isocitrate lyase